MPSTRPCGPSRAGLSACVGLPACWPPPRWSPALAGSDSGCAFASALQPRGALVCGLFREGGNLVGSFGSIGVFGLSWGRPFVLKPGKSGAYRAPAEPKPPNRAEKGRLPDRRELATASAPPRPPRCPHTSGTRPSLRQCSALLGRMALFPAFLGAYSAVGELSSSRGTVFWVWGRFPSHPQLGSPPAALKSGFGGGFAAPAADPTPVPEGFAA